MPVDRNGGVFQMALQDFIQRGILGDWIHMFPEGRTYQDQLKSCRNEQGCRYRKSGRTAPPGRDLGPMKWGVGKVVSDIIMNKATSSECTFENGVNNGKLVVLPYYHLNMEKVLPENEDLSLISPIPQKGVDIYCIVRYMSEGIKCSLENQLIFQILFPSTMISCKKLRKQRMMKN